MPDLYTLSRSIETLNQILYNICHAFLHGKRFFAICNNFKEELSPLLVYYFAG